MSHKPLQKDLFDEDFYYYDLHNDPAKLGTWRELLKEGDGFNWDGQEYIILDRNMADSHWLIERVST